MSDLIDRKIAVQGVRELFSLGDCFCDEPSIVGMLNGLKSAEPEQTEGIWTECEVFDNADYEIPQWQSARCSNCGKYHTTPYQYYFDKFPYCPFCGEKMESNK